MGAAGWTPVGAAVLVEVRGVEDWQPFDRLRLRLWHGVIDRTRGVGHQRGSASSEIALLCLPFIRLICLFTVPESTGAACCQTG